MKDIRKIIAVLLLLGSGLFFSCQDELVEINDETSQFNLSDQAKNLLLNIAKNDGSGDNIVDGASCFEVKLPFSVIVNGSELLIEDEDDYEVIEALFEQFSDDLDELQIVYPVTIIFEDYSEAVVENDAQLAEFAAQCGGENEEDDDIECIDFNYPITFSVFDANDDVSTVTVNSDKELLEFILSIGTNDVISVGFPITFTLSDGSTVTAEDADQLEQIIIDASDDCDEDDDNDFDDDDNNDITAEELIALLQGCEYEIDKFKLGNDSDNKRYEGFVITFGEDGIVRADDGVDLYEGEYAVIEDGDKLYLELVMEEGFFDDINDKWKLHVIAGGDSDNVKLDFRNGKNRIRFESKCKFDDDDDDDENEEEGSDFSAGEVADLLTGCDFQIDQFRLGDEQDDERFAGYVFTFGVEGAVEAASGDEVVSGSYTLVQDGDYVYFTLEMDEPLTDLNDTWKLDEVEFENDGQQVKLKFEINDNRVRFESLCGDE
ncbi:hypothetical protein [Croceiramulus getboli]|nr:hypothetical protein P8624_07660 [Flavobacteriaceae bacterium YJPT1-3]